MRKLKIDMTPLNMRKGKYKTVPFILIFLIIFSRIGLAQTYTCLDANTSYFSTTITVSGSSIPINYNDTCKFGCTNITGQCNPNPYNTNGIEFFILLGIAGILLFMGKSLSDEDWAISMFLLIASLVLIVASLGLLVTREYMTGNVLFSATLNYIYYFAIAIMMVIIFYYIIKTALKVLFSVTKRGKT